MRTSKEPPYSENGCSLPTDEREGLLDAYTTGELEPEKLRQLDSHVTRCPGCQQTLVELREYHRLLRGPLSDVLAPESERETHFSGQAPLPAAIPRQQARATALTSHRRRLAHPVVRVLLVAVALLIILVNIGLLRFFLQATQKAATPGLTASATSSAASTGVAGGKWQTVLTLPPAPQLPGNDQYPSYPLSIPAITSSPADPTTLYLCRLHLARGASLSLTVPHLLYRSDDQGAHWQELPLPAPAANCEIRPDPVQANIVVLEDNRNGAFVSRDRGQHWQRIPLPPGVSGPDAWKLQVTPVAGRLYVSGYWTSNLRTWTRWYPLPLSSQDPGNPLQSQGPIDLRFLVDPRHPDTIYTDMSPTCPGTRLPAGFPTAGDVLCRSDNDGQSWRLLAGIPVVPGSFDPSYCLVQANPEILYVQGVQLDNATRGGLMRSTNGGASWQIVHLFQSSQVGVSLKCSASNDPYPYSFDSQDPFFTYDVSKSHFAIVGDAQSNAYDVALTASGTFYYASDTSERDGQATLPSGIAVLSGTSWTRIAPLPPAYAEAHSQHHPPDIYRMMVQALTSNAGSPVILAYDDEHLYRYMGT